MTAAYQGGCCPARPLHSSDTLAGRDSTLDDSGKCWERSDEASGTVGGDAKRKNKYKTKSGGLAGQLVMAVALSSTMQVAESATYCGSTRPSGKTPKVHWPSWLITKSIIQEKAEMSIATLQGGRWR